MTGLRKIWENFRSMTKLTEDCSGHWVLFSALPVPRGSASVIFHHVIHPDM